MIRGYYSFLLKFLVLGYFIFSATFVCAKIIGNPPFKTIKIPSSEFGYHFDMEQDNEKTLYIAYERGVKIFDGARWQEVTVGEDANIRRLYFNQKNRIYFGGSGIIGYIYKDALGAYQFKDITPKKYKNNFNDIWHMSACDDDIVFMSLHTVFLYNQKKEMVKSWNFEAKLGAGFCRNHILTIQDRNTGLKELQNDKWVKSSLVLSNNNNVEKFEYINDDSYFILSQSNDWRIIQNNQIKSLRFEKELPSLDNYVTSAPLGEGKLVLGSNNGLLTFIDINKAQAQSFQLTNEWISQIISTEDELIVLTEFEIYYMQWPSAIRLQGKDSGLASSLLDVKQWNDHMYVAGSAGVFLEDKQQLVYQHKLFRRLNWTNKEAWFILPLDNKQALLSESHKLLLVEDDNGRFKTTAISDVIYPRGLVRSRFNPNLIYVITELDTQMLLMENGSWQFKPLFSQRANSIIENEKNSILITINGGGFFQVNLDKQTGQVLKQQSVSDIYQLHDADTENNFLILTKEKDIYAYDSDGIYELHKNQAPRSLFPHLKTRLKGEKISKLIQAEDGLFYGFTAFKLFYQDASKQWHLVDMAPYVKGIIDDIKLNNNQIKILSNGILVTYLKGSTVIEKAPDYFLRMTQIVLKQNGIEQFLPLNSKHVIKFDQGDVALTFSSVLNDLKNYANNEYRFKLSGETDGWSDFTNNSKIHISNITAGNYTLDIQAKGSANKIYEMPSYYFVVNPPWYLTGMAKIMWTIALLLVVGLLFHLLLKWREKIHETQKQELKHIIDEKTQALKKANVDLQKMAHLDGLTGLCNRFYLDDYIKNITTHRLKNMVVMMLDMDDFKLYNDKNGHIAGDDLLKEMAHYLIQSINRPQDIVARYGGEEFVVILLDCELSFAQAKAEEIRKSIENQENNTSVSIGICASSKPSDLTSLDAIYHLIDKADQALYEAKDAGRNKIISC